jgi:hypothetical protein
MRTKAMVVENSRPSPEAFSWASKADERWRLQRRSLLPARRQKAAERHAPFAHVPDLRRLRAGIDVLQLVHLLVAERQAEAVAESLQRGGAHLLLLVGDVLRLARLAHAIALDGFGEDYRRLAGVVHRGMIGGVDLVRVVAAAIEAPDVVVRPVGDHRLELRRVEEVLADVGAVLRLEGLVVAVDAFQHALLQQALFVLRQQGVPVAAPDHLDDVPAGAAEVGLQLLDDLAVAAHRAVEALQIAVDDEHQVVESLAAGQPDGAHRLRLVHFAVAHEGPHLAVAGLDDAAVVEVLHEARLVDRLQRAEAHRYRRELPEVRHQPRVRIGGEALAVHLAAEVVHLRLRQSAEHEGARIDARAGVALHEDHVAAVIFRRRVPEMVVADVVERGGGGEAGDVAAEVGIALVGAQHHGQGIPAHVGADAVLDGVVAGRGRFLAGRDGVDVGGGGLVGQVDAGVAGQFDQALDQVVGALRPFLFDDGIEGVEPFLGFLRVRVGRQQVVRQC